MPAHVLAHLDDEGVPALLTAWTKHENGWWGTVACVRDGEVLLVDMEAYWLRPATTELLEPWARRRYWSATMPVTSLESGPAGTATSPRLAPDAPGKVYSGRCRSLGRLVG